MTTQTPPTRFEDRLLEHLKLVVAQNPTPAADPARGGRHATRRMYGRTSSSWRRQARRLVLTAILAALAATGFAVATSLSGPRPAIAQAAVISRAAAALDQPNRILYLRVKDYSAPRQQICVRFGQCSFPTSRGGEAGISADPADDTVTYTTQEWVSPDGRQEHTIYSDGDETVLNQETHEDAVYDPADNTLTTLTDVGVGDTAPSGTPLPLPSPSDFENPTYYKSLFREAQAGKQNVQLVGRTTIAGTPAYELRFEIAETPPTHPPAGCGSTVCTPSGLEILVYLDSNSFTPVRSVVITLNTNDRPGLPHGASVTSVTDFSAQTLPDTSANERLLQMSPHPGAAQIKQTEARSKAALEAWMDARVQANRARAGAGPATASSTSSRHTAPTHP